METVFVSLCQKLDDTNRDADQTQQREEQSLLRFALRMCRKHGLVKDRVTLLTPSDFLQVLQLCQAKVHKKMGRGFQAENATIISVAQAVCLHKLKEAMRDALNLLHNATQRTTQDCSPSNRKDPAGQTPPQSGRPPGGESESESEKQCEMILLEYGEFLSSSNHVDAVDVLRVFLLELLSSQSELRAELASLRIDIVGSPLDPLQELIADQLTLTTCTQEVEGRKADPELIQKCVQVCFADTAQMKSLILSHDPQPEEYTGKNSEEDDPPTVDTSKELLQELFHSYLSLLVNTRSELALAHVFNTPDRGLTHQAFTHLKHQAQQKKMSLYQMATSVIIQLRLGGRGYAPDPNSKLLEHVKGLGLLTDLMSKLQQLLEDTECVRSSVLRVVGVIKKNLIGCQSQRYKREAVERVVDQIRSDLELVLAELESSNALISPDKPACQGGSLTSRRPRRVLLHYLDRCAASLWGDPHSAHHIWLSDIPFGPHTPSRFPCILSQFRSPALNGSASPSLDKQQKKEKGEKKKKLTVSTNLMPEESNQSLLQKCSKRLCDTVIVLPSKTIVHPAESRPSHPTQETADALSKENIQPMDSPARKKAKRSVSSKCHPSPVSAIPLRTAVMGSGKKEGGSRQQSSSLGKLPPKEGKKCRRRLLPPIKGQKSITSFFRV